MNDDRLEVALRECLGAKHTLDSRLKAETRRKLYERQERRGERLLCLIQIAMSALTLAMSAAAFAVNPGILPFLAGYTLVAGLIIVIVIMLYQKKTTRTERSEYYD